jgi:hypothetical protein
VNGRQPTAASAGWNDLADAPGGVTRFDVVCHPHVVETVLTLTRRWADDRALSDVARERLSAVVRAALGHGLRFDPRAVVIRIQWLDADRVRVDVRWLGCSETARPMPAKNDVQATISTLDTLADQWGFGGGQRGWVHWMTVATTG